MMKNNDLNVSNIKNIILNSFDEASKKEMVCTLREVTRNSQGGNSLINNDKKCLNFDVIAKKMGKNKFFKSVDGLYFSEENNTIYFLESKDISQSRDIKDEFIKKYLHSEMLFYFILSMYCEKKSIRLDIFSLNIEAIIVISQEKTRDMYAKILNNFINEGKSYLPLSKINLLASSIKMKHKMFYKRCRMYLNEDEELISIFG